MFGLAPYHGPGTEQPGGTTGHAGRGPSTVYDWYTQIRSLEHRAPETPVQSAVTGLRHNGEAGVVGALLGFISGEFGGLDIKGKYPADGIAALACYLASIKNAGQPDGFANDLRAIGQSCTSVYAFRTTEKWRRASKQSAGLPPPATHERVAGPRDPILDAARGLGVKNMHNA